LLARRITCSIAFGAAALLALGCVSPPDGEAGIRAQLSERSGEDAERAELADSDDLMPSEDELVAFALRRSAQFRASLADLGVAEAEWMRAGAPPPATFSVLFPLGSKQLEYAAKFPVDVLWLRPKRVAAAKRDWAATAECERADIGELPEIRVHGRDLPAARWRSVEARRDRDPFADGAQTLSSDLWRSSARPLTAERFVEADWADRELPPQELDHEELC
jgi:hypothetical protein